MTSKDYLNAYLLVFDLWQDTTQGTPESDFLNRVLMYLTEREFETKNTEYEEAEGFYYQEDEDWDDSQASSTNLTLEEAIQDTPEALREIEAEIFTQDHNFIHWMEQQHQS